VRTVAATSYRTSLSANQLPDASPAGAGSSNSAAGRPLATVAAAPAAAAAAAAGLGGLGGNCSSLRRLAALPLMMRGDPAISDYAASSGVTVFISDTLPSKWGMIRLQLPCVKPAKGFVQGSSALAAVHLLAYCCLPDGTMQLALRPVTSIGQACVCDRWRESRNTSLKAAGAGSKHQHKPHTACRGLLLACSSSLPEGSDQDIGVEAAAG
jgi:hypothetical protein